MTVLPKPPEAPGDDPAGAGSDPASVEALGRYAVRLRRGRTVYISVVTAIVVVIGVVVSVAWSRGEVANSTLRTVSSAPPGLPLADAVSAPRRAWSTGARAAVGQPQWGGTVVVFGKHDVHGVDARTGKTTWSYTRSTRTVCSVAQAGGVAVAVFRLSGNCDQVTALDAGTGKRKWDRTLDIDGQPLDGDADVQVANQGGFYTVVVNSDSVIYALDPTSGYNRWTYSRYACRIGGVALGSNGALIAQTCSSKVVCAGQKFCGAGPQLLLRNAYAARDDKSNDKNFDKIIWNRIGVRAVPLSADVLVAAADPGSGVIAQYDEKTGSVTARTTMTPRPSSFARIAAVHVGDLQLIWVGGTLTALRRSTSPAVWTARTSGPPTVVTADPSAVPETANARLTAPAGTGARALDPSDGRTLRDYRLDAAPGGPVYAFGDGYLATGSRGVTTYTG